MKLFIPIFFQGENTYYHTKMYKISKNVIDLWCKQNNFSVICCQDNGKTVFGRCKNGFSVIFKINTTGYSYYICHFTRNINNRFIELIYSVPFSAK